MKYSSAVATLFALSFLALGSPTQARPGDLSLDRLDARTLGPPMDPLRAMLEIRRPLDARYPSDWPCERHDDMRPHNPIPSYTITRRQLTVRCADNVDHVMTFSEIRSISIYRSRYTNDLARLNMDVDHFYHDFFTMSFPDEAQARTVANAFYSLAHPGQLSGPETDSDFQARVATARNAGDRSEPWRRAQIQAETVLRANRPVEAALVYYDALTASPDWGQGHYNLALVYGSLELYPEAITEMRRYLYLIPDASDARAAQDQIYGWEALLPSQAH